QPHYRRLERLLGWLIRRNNTFALHVHYAIEGKDKAIYLFNRLREYVPHLLALSVNSPFWQGEHTDMLSSRIFVFSRTYHRAGLPQPLSSWEEYARYVDLLHKSGRINKLGEIWWDVRPHPQLSTIEVRASDAQTAPWRTEALISLTAALCDALAQEHDSGDLRPIRTNREIEENKWSAQRYGLDGEFLDFDRRESVPTRKAIGSLLDRLSGSTARDLSGAARILEEPTEAERQLAVWRETGSAREAARDIVQRTRASVA
ncbi:MAG: YbdK family carboxylate-amine ligase, partial [Actinomycetota bacterium]